MESLHADLSRFLQHNSVDQIGLQIGKKDVLNTDPSADVDAKVIEVKIRLDSADSLRVAGLTNMKMRVVINQVNSINI